MPRPGAHQVWLAYSGVESLGMLVGWTIAPVYFVRVVHMSPLQLVLTGTAMEVTALLLQVPMGALADLLSRRAFVIAAQGVMGAAFVLAGIATSFWPILVASAFMGVGWALKDGAIDAWLADEVGSERLGPEFQRGAQVARLFELVGMGLAAGLALVELRLPIVIGGFMLIALAIGLVGWMPETSFPRAGTDDLSALRSTLQTARMGSTLVRGHRILLLMVGITFFAGAWDEGFYRLWEAHLLRNIGVPGLAGLDFVVWFGILNAGSLLLAMAAAHGFAGRLERLGRRGMAASLLGLHAGVLAGALVFALAGSFALAVAAFWAVTATNSVAVPVYRTWLNANVEDSRVRATVLSITAVGHSLGEASGGPVVGVLGNIFGIRAALTAGSFLLSPALFLYGRAIRQQRREPEGVQLAAGEA